MYKFAGAGAGDAPILCSHFVLHDYQPRAAGGFAGFTDTAKSVAVKSCSASFRRTACKK
jgi:hypothetical protein